MNQEDDFKESVMHLEMSDFSDFQRQVSWRSSNGDNRW